MASQGLSWELFPKARNAEVSEVQWHPRAAAVGKHRAHRTPHVPTEEPRGRDQPRRAAWAATGASANMMEDAGEG